MATKTKTHRAHYNNKKGTVESVFDSAVNAAEELGQAAAAFKESWKHLKKAQSKGTPATRAATRAGKQATRYLKSGARATYRGTKRLLPRSKSHRR